MIRRFGGETLSTYCQTLNGYEIGDELNKNIFYAEYYFLFVDLFW
jgi:hypothetical protein